MSIHRRNELITSEKERYFALDEVDVFIMFIDLIKTQDEYYMSI